MKKEFSVLQRAAALLAALCLLAGLALPVCAEGTDDALSAQNVETMQQGERPHRRNPAGWADRRGQDRPGRRGCCDPDPHADGNAHRDHDPHADGSARRDPDPHADGGPHCDPTPRRRRRPRRPRRRHPPPKPTPETDAHRDADTGRRGEQRKRRKFVTFAAVNAVAEGGSPVKGTTYTFYFAPPADWGEEVEFIGRRGAGNNDDDTEIIRPMSRVPGYTASNKRPIYVVSLQYEDNKLAECTHGGYVYIKFTSESGKHTIQNEWA